MYQFLYQFLHNYFWKSWTHRFDPPYWEIFKIRNTNLQFPSPRHGCHKNEKNRQLQNVICFTQTQKPVLTFISTRTLMILRMKGSTDRHKDKRFNKKMEAFLKPYQISVMEYFMKRVHGWKLFSQKKFHYKCLTGSFPSFSGIHTQRDSFPATFLQNTTSSIFPEFLEINPLWNLFSIALKARNSAKEGLNHGCFPGNTPRRLHLNSFIYLSN